MEFFTIFSYMFIYLCVYQMGYTSIGNNEYIGDTSTALPLWAAALIALGVYLVLWAFKGIGLFTMAKKQGKKKIRYLAFVPFASTFLMGELGENFKLGPKTSVKHVGLYAMIAEILYAAAVCVYYIPLMYCFQNSLFGVELDSGYISYYMLSDMPSALVSCYNVGYYLQYVMEFVYLLFAIFLYIVFFRRYTPASYVWMVILCALLPVVTPFLVFAFRKRTPVNYDDYMRQRYERMRQQQYYNQQPPYNGNGYGNGYNNNYGNGYNNGYSNGDNSGNGNGDGPEQDPFGEFGKSSGNGGSSSGNDPDDPFN